MLKDVRHAIRLLWGARGWTAIVVLSLGARHRRQHGALQRRQRHVADVDPGEGSRHARPLPVLRPERHGHELQRLRIPGENKGRPGRPRVVLLPDVPAVRRRQPDDDRPHRLRAERPRQSRRRRTGGYRVGVHLDRQLLSSPRYQRAHRAHDPAGGRLADGAARRGHQLEVLALALRHRPERHRQERARQQRAGHDRRRPAAAVHGHPAAGAERRRTSRCRLRSTRSCRPECLRRLARSSRRD